MLKVDCRKCVNCTGKECIPFGKDANVAVKKCADDGFKNYVTIDELNKCEQKSNIDLGMRIALTGVKEQINTITEELSRKGIDMPKGFSVLSGYVEDRLKELD